MALDLDIVTPHGLTVEGARTEELIAPGMLGELGILSDHLPLLAALDPGVLRFEEKSGEFRVFAVTDGVLEVDNNEVRILVENCVAAKDVDVEARSAELLELDAKMEPLNIESDEFIHLERLRAFCKAQIDASAI